VLDEVSNGLSFYSYTFLHEVPRLHCVLEDRLKQDDGSAHSELASFLLMGSWIGGDRDGQPVRHRRGDARHAAAAVEPHPQLLPRDGTATALGCRAVRSPPHLADVSDDLRRLAERSPDTSPHRSGEPYRLAVSGIYARLTATAAKLEVETTRRAVGKAEPYASVKELKADLDVLDRSLIANNSGVIARGRLRLLRRAVDCFRLPSRPGSTCDTNSAVHERTVAELLDAAMPGMSYLALSEEARVALLAGELRKRAGR